MVDKFTKKIMYDVIKSGIVNLVNKARFAKIFQFGNFRRIFTANVDYTQRVNSAKLRVNDQKSVLFTVLLISVDNCFVFRELATFMYKINLFSRDERDICRQE